MLTVCAIILDYFGSSKTMTCLASLMDQGLDTVMIVDNSGNPEANIQLQEALAKFQQQDIPFVMHQMASPRNLGYAAGVNTALRWMEKNHPHHYYLLINNDAEATPGMLQELLKFMRQHERRALCAPVIDMGPRRIPGFWYQRFSGLMFSHHLFGTFPFLTGCCLLVDRRIVDNGLFDEEFFMYGEDVELNWRLNASGWKIACANQATVQHEGVGSSRQGDYFYEYHMTYGHLLLVRKLAKQQWEIPLFYLGRIITFTARAVIRTIRYRSFVPLKAWGCSLREHFFLRNLHNK
jgi:hypothetical protein